MNFVHWKEKQKVKIEIIKIIDLMENLSMYKARP